MLSPFYLYFNMGFRTSNANEFIKNGVQRKYTKHEKKMKMPGRRYMAVNRAISICYLVSYMEVCNNIKIV